MLLSSASEKQFYDDTLGGIIPDDAIEITPEEHARLFDGLANGLIIVFGDDGRPTLAERPPLSVEEIKSQALARRDVMLGEAAIRIAPLQDAVDLDKATAKDAALLKKWKNYRVDLNRIQDQEGFPQSIDWPIAPDAQA